MWILENVTAEAVSIRRDVEENARQIIQDVREQADRILGTAPCASTACEPVSSRSSTSPTTARPPSPPSSPSASAPPSLRPPRTSPCSSTAGTARVRPNPCESALLPQTRSQPRVSPLIPVRQLVCLRHVLCHHLHRHILRKHTRLLLPPSPDVRFRHRTSVTVFFVGHLAHVTDGFSSCIRDREEVGSQHHARTD